MKKYENGIFTDSDGTKWEHLTDLDMANLRSIKLQITYNGETETCDAMAALQDLYMNTSSGFNAYKLYPVYSYVKLDPLLFSELDEEFYNKLKSARVVVEDYCIRQNPVSTIQQLVKQCK